MDSVRESEEYKRRSSSVRRSDANKERSKRLTAFQARFEPTKQEIKEYETKYGNIFALVAEKETAVNVNKATRRLPPRQTVRMSNLTQTLPRYSIITASRTTRKPKPVPTLNPRTTISTNKIPVDEYSGGKSKSKLKDTVKDKKSKPVKNIK